MELSSSLAALVGFACEAVLWGVNCTLFLVSVIILQQRRSRDSIYSPVVYLNVFVFLSCTTHFALEFSHFYTALSTTGVTDYSNETSELVGADILISFTDLLGNFLLIYRCWMLWGENYYVAIPPLITAVIGFACILGVIGLLLSTNPSSPAPPPALVPLGTAGYVLPLCTNIMVTSLIAYRIWSSSRAAPDSPLVIGRDVTRRAIVLTIESGFLYLLFQLVFVILFAAESTAVGILAVMAVQIYGIAPTLIIIRVGLGTSPDKTVRITTNAPTKWVVRRGDDLCLSTIHYSDGPTVNTDFEVSLGPV